MNSRSEYNVGVPTSMLLSRKMNGVFYTPKQTAHFLADRILSHTAIDPHNVGNLQILDPMVGSGELLVAFCQEILARFPEQDKERLLSLLPQILYGADIDHIAIEQTRRNLASALLELGGNNIEPNSFTHIVEIDSLIIGGIEKVFPGVFCREGSGFSVVIANPPWEVVKANDREFFSLYDCDFHSLDRESRMKKKKTFLSDQSIRDQYELYLKRIDEKKEYVTKNYMLNKDSGEINLYRVSLERILQLTRNDGIVGIITPTGLAGESGTSRIRRELLLNNRILEMWGATYKV